MKWEKEVNGNLLEDMIRFEICKFHGLVLNILGSGRFAAWSSIGYGDSAADGGGPYGEREPWNGCRNHP